MNIRKLDLIEFKISKNGEEFPETEDSLNSALENMSLNDFHSVKYFIQYDDRNGEFKKSFGYEEIAQLNEQQIKNLIEKDLTEQNNKY